MKNNYLKGLGLLAATLMIGVAAFSKVVTIQVANFQFTPSTVNAVVGDTIKWLWVNGGHTTTSGGIPAGAPSWDSPIAAADPSFNYKIVVPGTYNYVCKPHAPGMAGVINAVALNGVSQQGNLATGVRIYPNPFEQNFTIDLGEANLNSKTAIVVYDLLGKEVHREWFAVGNRRLEVEPAELAAGIYFVYLYIDGRKTVYKLVKGNAK